MTRLEEIRARERAATPGPWTFYGSDGWRASVMRVMPEAEEYIADCFGSIATGGRNKSDDAAFIAHARHDIPWLLDEVERLEAERDRAVKLLETVHEHLDLADTLAKKDPSWEHRGVVYGMALGEIAVDINHKWHSTHEEAKATLERTAQDEK